MRTALVVAIGIGLLAMLAMWTSAVAAPARPVPKAKPAGGAQPAAEAPAASETRAAAGVTDEAVQRAIDKAKEWLINGADNTWASQFQGVYRGGTTAMAIYTLAYIGELPDKPFMAKALDELMGVSTDRVYVRSMRILALALVQGKLAGARRTTIRLALLNDVQWLVNTQHESGGWDYMPNDGNRFDFSNTQLAILALWQATLAGVEIPSIVWERTQKLYYSKQQRDGSWNYGDAGQKEDGGDTPGYGSMTAAGLASIYICADMLDLASGCPCRSGKSGGDRVELNRRLELALGWLSKQFEVEHNPAKPSKWHFYWLYAAERVGVAAGYKYFGTHDWFKEGAEYLVSHQAPNGSWNGGDVSDTCFATLFLYKGRAPILYQKLMIPNCEWNSHRRDLANLTAYIEKTKEQPFHWQITSLVAPVEELHDAPILYISVETAPKFTEADKKKLREFTDTGGTILFEPTCGNTLVKEWFQRFAKEIWPEWAIKPLGPDHPAFAEPYALKTQRPEILGVHDGLRTCVFYALDDLSCPWQTKGLAGKDYLFKWGINLYTYATDKGKLRAKLEPRQPPAGDRYASPVKAAARKALSLARLKTDGDWMTGRNYKGLEKIAAEVSKRAGLDLKVDETGVDAAALAAQDVAYVTGSKEVKLAEAPRAALKAYVARGGLVWAEAAGGSPDFDKSFRTLTADLGWKLQVLERISPALTGRFPAAVGYNLARGVQFRRVLKVDPGTRPAAELEGIYADGKLVGVYSPYDIVFSATPFDAFNCRGYAPEDAVAVAINVLLFLTDHE
jgi:hypothetical protein